MNRAGFLKLMGVTAGSIALAPFIGSMRSASSAAALPYPPTEGQGQDIRKWAIRWSQWALSFNDKDSPVMDETGKIVQRQQPDSEMFFLTGGYMDLEKARADDDIYRIVTIPSTMPIFFPILMGLGGNDKDVIFTSYQELKRRTIAELDTVSRLECTVDGKPIAPVRANSGDTFYQYFPKSELYEYKETGIVKKAFSDGYWVLLSPLDRGEHTLTLFGRLEQEITTGVAYENKATYTINVI